MMCRVSAILLAVCLCSSPVAATVDPQFCTVMPWDALNGALLCPQFPDPPPASQVEVVVRDNNGNPYQNAFVQITFTAESSLCPSTVLEGMTNVQGEVSFDVGGGGCAHEMPTACVIKANGITIRDYLNAKSPDHDGVSGDGVVNLVDLIQFSNEFLGILPNQCHDYDNNGNTGIEDLIVFAQPFIDSNTCP